jgi:hypothetical protein
MPESKIHQIVYCDTSGHLLLAYEMCGNPIVQNSLNGEQHPQNAVAPTVRPTSGRVTA